jgi:hypothetical protein
MNDIVDFTKHKQSKESVELEHRLIISTYKDNSNIQIVATSGISDVEAIQFLQDAISGIMATWDGNSE